MRGWGMWGGGRTTRTQVCVAFRVRSPGFLRSSRSPSFRRPLGGVREAREAGASVPPPLLRSASHVLRFSFFLPYSLSFLSPFACSCFALCAAAYSSSTLHDTACLLSSHLALHETAYTHTHPTLSFSRFERPNATPTLLHHGGRPAHTVVPSSVAVDVRTVAEAYAESDDYAARSTCTRGKTEK